jgi:hypothetical protein
MTHRLLLIAACLQLVGCGPSDTAYDPPPADPGTAALRTGMGPNVVFADAPILCGPQEGAPAIEGQFSCLFERESESGTDRVDIILRYDELVELAEGTVMRTGSELELYNVGIGTSAGVGMGSGGSSWHGTLTVTLGPIATVREATLDGALSSVVDDRYAVSFNAVPIVIQ